METINPKTGEVLPEGEEGELVFTTLTKEAFPLIRYRSGDISRLITEPCRCGRTHIKMERVLNELAVSSGVGIEINEMTVPVKAEVYPSFVYK